MNLKMYVDDSVYAEWEPDIGRLILTTENGIPPPSNKIYLEREVFENLAHFYGRWKEQWERDKSTPPSRLGQA